MSKKTSKKRLLSDSIIFNIIAIGVVGMLLIIITLLFMNVYTRHGENVIVPDLKGLQAKEAEALLVSKGLDVLIIDSIFSNDAVPGSIIDQSPKPNNKVKEGRSIYITIYSFNPQKIAIPDLDFYSSRQAISLLNSIGFPDIEIVEQPAEYSDVVLSVEYKGKKLVADELVPLGHPLRLIVGVSVSETDSLGVNEHLVLPSGDTNDFAPDKNKEQERSNIDDSFF